MRHGLSGRLVGALALTSCVSLIAAAVLLLPPLESRIRRDELATIGQRLRAQRAAIARDLPPAEMHPGSRGAARAARALKRRVGGDIVLVGADQRVLAATDIDPGERFPEAAEAIRTGKTVRATTEDDHGSVAHVAVPANVNGTTIALVAVHRLDDANEAAGVVRHAFLVAAAISLGLALLLGLWLARRLVLRLRALRDAALRVAELGPVVEMRSDDARDEVGDLTRALVTMQNRLRDQERARRAFVANASHELRTPLASLRVMIDLLLDDLDRADPDLGDARKQAGLLDEQAERLATLAANLLDLSRVDAGVPSRAELTDVADIARGVSAEFGARAKVDLDAGGPAWAIADPDAVAQILRILLDNAIRHGPPGGPVNVAVRQSGGRPSILVQDTGTGIAPGDRERIFERFERGSADPGTTPGFGLGLAIGRELARRMGGELTLEDEPHTTFRLALAPAPEPGLDL